MPDSNSSFSSSKYYNSMPQIVVIDHGRVAAGKDSSKNGVKKDANGSAKVKGIKSFLKPPKTSKKKKDRKRTTKSSKSKRQKRDGKKSKKTTTTAVSHDSQSRTQKILSKFKPRLKSNDDNEADKLYLAAVIFVMVLFASSMFLIMSIVCYAIDEPAALGFFVASNSIFLSTFPGALIYVKWNREHGIIAFSLGQIIIGSIELFFIATIWMDYESYTEKTTNCAAALIIVVVYQFIATIFINWRPYSAVATRKTDAPVKSDQKKEKKDDQQRQQQPTFGASKSSIVSVEIDKSSAPSSKASTSQQSITKQTSDIWKICDDKLVTPNVRPACPKDASSTGANTTFSKDNKSDKSSKTVSTQAENNEGSLKCSSAALRKCQCDLQNLDKCEVKAVPAPQNFVQVVEYENLILVATTSKTPKRPSQESFYTVSMASTPIKKLSSSGASENHVVFQLPDELKNQSSSSGKSFPNISTPSDAGSINADFADATPLREFSHAESKQSSTTQGSVYAASNLR